jgi:hypothetical protein
MSDVCVTTMTRNTNLMQQLRFITINYLYMFRASICPSSGVQVVCYRVWYSELGVAAVIPEEPAPAGNKSHLLHQVGTSRHIAVCYRMYWLGINANGIVDGFAVVS